MATAPATPDWCSLPDPILFDVAQCLQTQTELSRFRAVCRSFHFAVPLPSPKLLLVIAESTVYALQSLSDEAPPWIVNVEKSSQGKTRVQDPYSCRHFEEHVLDYRVQEIGQGWNYVLLQKVAVSTDIDELAVMAFLNLELMVFDLGFGDVDVQDIVYYKKHKKQFRVVMSNGHILGVDPKSLEVCEPLPPLLTRFTYKSFVNASSV